MASDINKVIMVGRITKEIDVKTTNNGGKIAEFSLASNRMENKGDTWKEAVGFFDCILFGKRSEALVKYAGKGSKICVEGKLRWSSWEGSDGKKFSKVEIAVDEFQFLDSKKTEGAPQGHFDSASVSDDIPF